VTNGAQKLPTRGNVEAFTPPASGDPFRGVERRRCYSVGETMPESAANVVRAFVAAINAGDPHALRALMTEDHTFTDALGNRLSGADNMLSGWRHFFHAYPDYRICIQRSFAEGNWVALFGEATGRWRVKDQVLSQMWKVAAAWLAEVETGRIKNWSVFCDTNWVNPPQ
jgi:uncharacterized protein (TIGR02246 family)